MKPDQKSVQRRRPMGAEIQPGGGVSFRVWAPQRQRVTVVLEPSGEAEPVRAELKSERDGYFSAVIPAARAGDHYRFALDGAEQLFPDPASRFQPAGPHGPSQVIDPGAFTWTDESWSGIMKKPQVIYEMHVGTFTGEGTWQAALQQLPMLAELGVTILQIMPVADFPGRFGWGYDGVNLFAPTRLYGLPDEFRRFVDAAHAAGLAVILDVVYNHLGPDGNHLPQFSKDYFSTRHQTDWGAALNFDGENCAAVREYVLSNAEYWIDEYHLDGLRLDATQNIYDDTEPHILAEITSRARAAAGERTVFIVAENEPQDVRLIRSREEEGHGLDAIWNDDFHHTSMVLLSGHSEAYYTDYRGTPQEFISALKWGFLFQGQWYSWQKHRRGTAALDQPPTKFVSFIQNHDQIANSCRGVRCHSFAAAGSYRALTALYLLAPQIPMLFQGQEFASSAPFFYFADHREELARMVHEGRCAFMRQFRSVARPEVQAKLPDPADPATFLRCKLDFAERDKHAEVYSLHKDLLKLRQTDPVFKQLRAGHVDGAVLSSEAFLIRFFANSLHVRPGRKRKSSVAAHKRCERGDRLMVVNFGSDLHLDPAPEPLLAPPAGCRWEILWSSEDFPYGGTGTASLESEQNWQIPGHAAVVMRPQFFVEEENPHAERAPTT
ncbi:MAG: malto-oligosyltrehalose trehalohydrolase [Planctomycetaceae bacterium]